MTTQADRISNPQGFHQPTAQEALTAYADSLPGTYHLVAAGIKKLVNYYPVKAPEATTDREDLLSICEAGFVPQEHWSNRDTASAQKQLGEAYALLKAGCEFWIDSNSDPRTIWLTITYEGFAHKDYDGGLDTEHFYLPTKKRLADANGTDWY